MQSQTGTGRDLRVDFLRGLALIFIFWDHIPGNILGQLTLRNIGFSDAAEVFVFLAGYGAALAYSRRLLQSNYFVTALHILGRSWTLYIAHVFLLSQLMALIFIANNYVETRDFVEETGLGYFVGNPTQALVDGLLLRFKPGLMDPLPLYIVLLVALAALLPALMRYPFITLLFSGLLYVVAVQKHWNFSAQPHGVWFFNPLAWQFLFFLGAAMGIHGDTLATALQNIGRQWRQRLLIAALIFLALSAALALSWNWPEWHDRWMPITLAQLIYPIDKTNLAFLRLLHFLALAFCVALLLPDGPWLQTRLAQAIRLMGRHSLVVFCIGVLLAPLADSVNTLAHDSVAMQCITSLLGCAIMWLAAFLPEWYRQQQLQPLDQSVVNNRLLAAGKR